MKTKQSRGSSENESTANANRSASHEHLGTIHRTVFAELNRSRDWPFKAFVSVFSYFGILGLFYKERSPAQMELWAVTLVSILLLAFTIKVIVKQHYRYQEYRIILANIQRAMGLHELKSNGNALLPDDWTKSHCMDKLTLKGTHSLNYGVLFYLTFLICITLVGLISVWC